MGYYSTYEGEYHVSGKINKKQNDYIKSWFFKRFGQYKLRDERNDDGYGSYIDNPNPDGGTWTYLGDIVYDFTKHTIVPTSIYMKGYDFNEHLYEAVRAFNLLGIKLKGSVYRTGEDHDDRERIDIVNGRVMCSAGEIVWSKWEECTETEQEKLDRFEKEYKIPNYKQKAMV